MPKRTTRLPGPHGARCGTTTAGAIQKKTSSPSLRCWGWEAPAGPRYRGHNCPFPRKLSGTGWHQERGAHTEKGQQCNFQVPEQNENVGPTRSKRMKNFKILWHWGHCWGRPCPHEAGYQTPGSPTARRRSPRTGENKQPGHESSGAQVTLARAAS